TRRPRGVQHPHPTRKPRPPRPRAHRPDPRDPIGGASMNCPRCHAVLTTETELGIEVDRCHTCNGRWLDHDELAQLEATTASTEADRRATIEYGERLGGLHCPICDKLMTAFDYRAYDIELDACPEH